MTIGFCVCEKEGYFEWATLMYDCVYTPTDYASFFMGLLSIACWMTAQIPQIIKNFIRMEAESVSIWFFIAWLTGDISNLVGCLLTHQLPTQTLIAAYWVIVDIISVCQVLLFQSKGRIIAWIGILRGRKQDADFIPVENGEGESEESLDGNGDEDVNRRLLIDSQKDQSENESDGLQFEENGQDEQNAENPAHHTQETYKGYNSLYAVVPIFFFALVVFNLSINGTPQAVLGRKLLSDKPLCDGGAPNDRVNTVQDWIGWSIGCLCGFCYFISRIFQLVKNFRRGNADGLSIIMFILAVIGNLSYGFSIVFRSIELRFLFAHLPWLIGSQVTMVWDCMIFVQFLYFGFQKKRKARKQKKMKREFGDEDEYEV